MGKSSSSGESSSSKSLLFMMAAMFCGCGVLLAGGLLMASRVIHALQLRAEGDKSTVRTPIGDFRFEKAQQVGPGLPVYPQSSLVLPGGPAAHPPGDESQPQVVASTYHTNSSREYVNAWYLEHLSPEFVRQDPGHKNLPELFKQSHLSDDDITFVGERGDQVRVVALETEDSGTKIILLRSAKPSTQGPPQSQPQSLSQPQTP